MSPPLTIPLVGLAAYITLDGVSLDHNGTVIIEFQVHRYPPCTRIRLRLPQVQALKLRDGVTNAVEGA